MEKYLFELLETNNRVIVPDLGAFIIRQQEPRELVFNDLLAFNDGMLTSHIKQQEGISMSKAQVKIEEFVDQVKKVLTKGDIYHLQNLGYLKMDDSSKIEFSVTKFPTARAEVVSAATLSQEEDIEEPSEQPESDTKEETPLPAVEEVFEEEAPMPEVPEEEDTEEEAPEEEAPEAETPEKESSAEADDEWKALDGVYPEEEAALEEVAAEEDPEAATEDGSFTLEDQTAEIEVDASDETPLIPDPEEPPFMIEEQEKQEEQKVKVVGTSQARLEAAAKAAAIDDEKKAQESEQESMSTAETNIPYYVEREKRTTSIWPWIGGTAALIIILLVAAWFFFPEEVNRILSGKSTETATTEEQVYEDSSAPGQETTSDREEEAETEQDQGVITGETDAPGSESGEDDIQKTEADQTPGESLEETETEPETPPAGQTKKYYIVAGMFSSRTNAEDYVNTLKAKGFNAELFGRKDNLYAVSFSSHVSKTAALLELNRIREQFNSKAWLLYY